MPLITVRRTIFAAVAIAFATLLLAAALPLIASTQIVRNRIAQEMGAWSGYRVILGKAPEIQVWPNFHATLKNVTLAEWGSDGRSPVMRSERVEIDLSAIAALRGEVTFSKVRLFRPVIYVQHRSGALYLPAAPGGGRIARSIELARTVVKTNPAKPDSTALASDPFGSIEFTDGRIVMSRGGKNSELITGLSGNIDWAALNRGASLNATGIWRGENVTLGLSSDQPLILFAGGNAPVSFTMKSAPLTASFTGTVNISEGAFLDGSANFSSPSLRRMLEWSRADVSAGASIGSISVTSKVSGNIRRLKFDHAQITLDGNPGIGALNVSFADPMPGISGTLAFDTIDLHSFLAAFTPLASLDDDSDDLGLIRRTNVDLRLSAVKATAGPVTLANVAATAQVKQGLAVFDVSDATAFGGDLQTGVRIDRKANGNHVELRFLATNIDGAQFAKAAGFSKLFPQATGTISLMLKGVGKHWDAVFEDGDGQISANFGAGKMPGIDLANFIKRSTGAGFFPLSAVASGTLPIDGLDLKATIAHGVATIDKAEAKSGDQIISLTGIVPYVGHGLALSGTIYKAPLAAADKSASAKTPDAKKQTPALPTPNSHPTAAFFVGGSWSAPFVSPVYPTMMPE